MLHTLDLQALPRVSAMYRIERQTIWQTCDQENILVAMEVGRCLFTLNGKPYIAAPGDLVFIPAGQDYKREPMDDAPAIFTYFHFSLPTTPTQRRSTECAKELSEQQALLYRSTEGSTLTHKAYLYTVTPLPDEAAALCREAISEHEHGHVDKRLFDSLHTAQLLALASRVNVRKLMAGQSQLPDTIIPAKLKHAILYIRNHHDKPITVGEVCLEAGISRQHMIRLFRSELGMTPIQYINHTKIMHAKDLIRRNRQISIKELAYELGFSDEHYFSRLFTRIVNESPSQFRSRVNRYHDDDHDILV